MDKRIREGAVLVVLGIALLVVAGALIVGFFDDDDEPGAVAECGGRAATIVGTDGSDDLVGTSGDDVIVAYAGDDEIRSGAGDDLVCAGPGDDDIDGGPGNDVLYGEAGNDVLAGGDGRDSLFGNSGDDDLRLDQPGEANAGSGDDVVVGSLGDDELAGGPGADQLRGRAGDDVLDGGAGPDVLWGGLGDDRLLGGAGEDTLAGRSGIDQCDGGADEDDADAACETESAVERTSTIPVVECEVPGADDGLGPISDPATRFVQVAVGDLQPALVRYPTTEPASGLAEYRFPGQLPILYLDPNELAGYAEALERPAADPIILATVKIDTDEGEALRVTAAFVLDDEGRAQILHRSCDPRIIRALRRAAREVGLSAEPSTSWSALVALQDANAAVRAALYNQP